MSLTTNKAEERNRLIDGAVQAGKFTPERADYWRRRYEKDPAGVRAGIAQMIPGVLAPPRHRMSENDVMRALGGRPVEPEEVQVDPEVDRIMQVLFGQRAVV